MDYLFIEKCIPEIQALALKKRIKSIKEEKNRISIELPNQKFLNICLNQPNALFFSGKAITNKESRNFRFLEGNFIKSVSLPFIDRVVEFVIVKVSLSGKKEEFKLILELTGKNANAVVTNQKNTVLAIHREFASSVRELKPGVPYTFPPQEKKSFEELKFGTVTPEGVEKQLHKFVAGISPLNAKEIALYVKKGKSLEEAYREFLLKHRTSKTAFLYFKEGKPAYMTTFPYESLSGLKCQKFEGKHPFLECWKAYYSHKISLEEEKKRKAEEKKVREFRLKLIEELKSLPEPEELLKEAEKAKREGELLKYNLYLIKPGDREVTLKDFTSGEDVKVEVDPSISPRENMERRFQLYRKLLRKAEHIKRRKEEILRNLKDLVLESDKKREQNRKEESLFRKITLPSGKQILIGRNQRENELLSLKKAKPWDIWFHAKATSGSHVILKRNRGERVSENELLLAASAAAYFSKGRDNKKVEVDFTEVKNLRKPPGTPKGFVTYSTYNTLIVEPKVFEDFLKEIEKKGSPTSRTP